MLPSSFRALLVRFAPAGLRTRWVRIVLALAVLAYFLAGSGLLVLRWAVLPRIAVWRPQLEHVVSAAIGLPVSIAGLAADWDALRPRLRISGLSVRDSAGREALRLDHVEASLGWSSLYLGRLRLHRLVVDQPDLDIRREADGRISVAGIELRRDSGGHPGFADWLLDQRSLLIRNARVGWTDLQRDAPELVLTHVNLRLDNAGDRHRFGLTAEPPRVLAAPFDLRGDLVLGRGAAPGSASGQIYAGLDYADLDRWQRWIDMPIAVRHGLGGIRLWLVLSGGQLRSAAADVALRDVGARFAAGLPELELSRLTGRIRFARKDTGWELSGREIALATNAGADMASTDFSMRWDPAAKGKDLQGSFAAAKLDVGVLSGLATHLPFPRAWREQLIALAPRGEVEQLELAWSGSEGWPQRYRIKARFEGLGVAPLGLIPGGDGWSGSISGDEHGGEYEIAVRDGALLLPAVFEQAAIALDDGHFVGGWARKGSEVAVTLKDGRFRNDDAAGVASGSYLTHSGGAGEIALDAALARGDARSAWRYVPLVVPVEVRNWLQAALVKGRVDGVRVRLAGDLDRFPFRDGKGEFRIDGRIHDTELKFAPGWPEIKAIDGRLGFDRARMEILAERGMVFGAHIAAVRAVIPDLEHGLLEVSGDARGATAEFLHFVNASPIANAVGHFTRPIEAVGDGALTLNLSVPLDDAEHASARGEFRFEHNRLVLIAMLPEISDASGRFSFTERSISIPEATGQFAGAPVRVTGKTRPDGAVEIDARGSFNARSLANLHPSPVWDHLSGTAPAAAQIVLRDHDVDLTLESSLAGIGSSLPEPFNKSAPDAKPIRVGMQWRSDAAGMRQSFGAEVQGAGRLLLAMRERNGSNQIERGVLALGTADTSLPAAGLALRATLPVLDIDGWRRAFAGDAVSTAAPLQPDSVDLNVGDLRVEDLRFERQNLHAERSGDQWTLRLQGPTATGELVWEDRKPALLRGNLTRLALVPAPGTIHSARPGRAAREESDLPGVDLALDAFALNGRELGAVRLKGHPKAHDWILDQLTIVNQDGHVDVHGEYLAEAGGSTRLRFALEADDAGGLLTRLGYPGTLRRGTARAEGSLSWNGRPVRPDYPSMAGLLSLQAERGQFSKIDPGVARLFGVLSLQALPRRATLDFRDVFSEGFAFDSISGSMKINQGILRTDDLSILGPAAKVALRGSVDLTGETQDLAVTVQPTLSETVAIGAALGPAIGTLNPLVGVAAYVAQKILSDPVERLFTYKYQVVGSWADPRVRKLSGPMGKTKGDAE